MFFLKLFYFVFECLWVRHTSLLLVHILQHQEHTFQLFYAHVVSKLWSELNLLLKYILSLFRIIIFYLFAADIVDVDLRDVGVNIFVNHWVLDDHKNFSLGPHFCKYIVDDFEGKYVIAIVDEA